MKQKKQKKPRPLCCFPDCTERQGRTLSWCAKHTLVAYACRIEGCKNRVASWNRSRCCEDHREYMHIYRGIPV